MFISSSSNDPLFGYNTSYNAIILDDIRATMSLSDTLKLLDNHTCSTVRSRYSNKILNCELMILTTVLPINSFYKQIFQNELEPAIQFKRRIGTYIKMTKSTISVQRWNDIEMEYSEPIVYFNDTLVELEAQKIANLKTPKEEIETLIPFLSGKEITNTQTPNTLKPETSETHAKEKPNKTTDDIEIVSEIDFEKILYGEEI